MLHGQSNVVGGDGEEALQIRIRAQVGTVGLQEGPQCAVAHVLHDQDVRFYAHRRWWIHAFIGQQQGPMCSSLTLAGVPVQQLEDVPMVHQLPHDGNLCLHMFLTDTLREKQNQFKFIYPFCVSITSS